MRRRGGMGMGRLIVAAAVAIFALISYFGSSVYNPVTGEDQHISISQEQEVALGLQSAPQMAQQFGGLDPDESAQRFLDEVCAEILRGSTASESGYPFECHLLGDAQTVNAFALPGGQVFITRALWDRLETEEQLAGVMGHEIAHVVARHSAEHIAKQQLTQGLTGAVIVASYDPDNPASARTAQMAAVIGQLVNMQFSRSDELESDVLGVRFLAEAGYNPCALIDVMRVLAAAGGGARQPEFFSTHPNPDNRIENIRAAIEEYAPGTTCQA